jgi:hypothetical protein
VCIELLASGGNQVESILISVAALSIIIIHLIGMSQEGRGRYRAHRDITGKDRQDGNRTVELMTGKAEREKKYQDTSD